MMPLVEEILPDEQAGFRPGRCTLDQVLNLTQDIEDSFQNKLKTGAIFVDLTAAYDTIWHRGLALKLHQCIPSKHLIKMILELICNRSFTLRLGDKKSRLRRLRNGLPQGSVLAPILFNIYTADLPTTRSKKYVYADDICMATSAKTLDELSYTLTEDMKELGAYFQKWHLSLSVEKTVASAFHLNNRQANHTLNVSLGARILDHEVNPTYLGITLDRSLTFRTHLEKLKKKISTRVNLIRKVAGTKWGANTPTLRTSTLALVYAPAEYCAPVWSASSHTPKLDVELNASMRLVSGTLRSTPTTSLPVLSHISPPHIRREALIAKTAWKALTDNKHLLHRAVKSDPQPTRLSSRSSFSSRARPYLSDEAPATRACRKTAAKQITIEKWTTEWKNGDNNIKDLRDPTEIPPGFNLPRKSWCRLNRLITGHGRTGHMLHKWNMTPTPACDCGASDQTAKHIIEECHMRKLDGGITRLAECDPTATQWLNDLDLDI